MIPKWPQITSRSFNFPPKVWRQLCLTVCLSDRHSDILLMFWTTFVLISMLKSQLKVLQSGLKYLSQIFLVVTNKLCNLSLWVRCNILPRLYFHVKRLLQKGSRNGSAKHAWYFCMTGWILKIWDTYETSWDKSIYFWNNKENMVFTIKYQIEMAV